MTRPEGSVEELEMRRKLAVRLLDRGMDGQEVAEAFDVSPGSVSRWKQTYEEEEMEELEADPHPGLPMDWTVIWITGAFTTEQFGRSPTDHMLNGQ